MLASETTLRVDPRTRRTRQLLLDAFGQLLTEKSFEDITVQDITERATVNRATFYAHFDDKYALLDYSTNEMIRQALDAKLPPDANYSPANLRILIQTVCEFLSHLRTHCAPSNRNQFDSMVEHRVKQHLYTILLRWLGEQNDHPAPSTEMELQATMTSWAIYGAAARWSSEPSEYTSAEFSRRVLPLVLANFQAPSYPQIRL